MYIDVSVPLAILFTVKLMSTPIKQAAARVTDQERRGVAGYFGEQVSLRMELNQLAHQPPGQAIVQMSTNCTSAFICLLDSLHNQSNPKINQLNRS